MKKPSRLEIILCSLILAAMPLIIAHATFRYRNPKANGMAFLRDFRAVVTFQKLEEYQ